MVAVFREKPKARSLRPGVAPLDLLVANLGDSRAVLCRGGKAVMSTTLKMTLVALMTLITLMTREEEWLEPHKRAHD